MSASTFSYAQAARGRAVSQPSLQETSSPAPSTTGSQGKDDASTGATSVTAPSVASTSPEIRDIEHATQAQVEGRSSKQDSEASSVVGSNSSTASVAEQSSKTPEEGSAKTADVPTQPQSQSEDKASRSASRTSRFNDSAEGRKGRKGKKSRANDKDAHDDPNQEEDADKVKEPPKPVILTEAAPPAVNPWAKRMEAQKTAVQTKVAPDGTSADGESKQNSPQEDAGVRSAMPNGVNGDKWAQKKPAEASRPADQAQRRSGPRGSRTSDKDEKSSAAVPLAADPSSWPDPKSAAEREQPVRKTQDKADAAEKDNNLDEAGPTRKKTWEKLEIVHSVVFETQLPPPRGSKPRASAPRGGREAGTMRGNHPAAATATAAAAAVAQPAATSVSDNASSPGGSTAPKTATTRPREGSVPSRAASQPQPSHASKRASIDVASRDQRKPPVPGSTTEQARDTSIDASSSSKRASATRDIRIENGSLGFESGQTTARAPPQERNNFQARGDYAKDGAHGQQYPARDSRPERGRGGGYRARGGHNSSSAHLPSASYAPNGHYPTPNGFQSRQNPNAHSPPPFSGQFPTSFGHPSRGRGNKWAGSGQSAGRNNAGTTGFPPKGAQVNDYAVGQYPPYMYSPVYDASIPILRSQVEYYLSVENLCKDYYLRQHMDGQGFVHLSFIAGFKRVKAVTDDPELFRLACSFSEQIDFGVGDDGIERLRIRDKWQLFVLPASERAEPHRNDGPANFTAYAKPDPQLVPPFPSPMVPQPYPSAAAGAFQAYPEEQMYPPSFVNGAAYDPSINGGAVNGHHHGHETQLSAGVPEYAPPQSPVTLESMTNFSDSQVENLMMILGYDEKDDAGSSDAVGVAGYVPGVNGDSASSPEVQSISGDATCASASAEPLDQADQSGRGVVWVDGQASASTKEQRDRKAYTEIRKAALEQRQNAKAGETPREMQKLFKFWSQMLLNDFNAKVYQEFRDLALEDASREVPLTCGLTHLVEFYDRLLLETNTRKPWPQDRAVPEIFTAHLNEAVELNSRLGGKDVAAI
ncbi:hypothetical protein C8A00DRAFT_28897 [Chaetomidium leptoderma]|uniref:HTH La-type RNA-binding domain-containing protein n=1 Tax=Chaetomidium leptoderma TaxID=669021 RepID=A0AAN6VUS1_9PEZI|nr:hypothetical protein C8A00DRAFT_28897 [Chaetomidium leptoderma]